VSRPRSEGAPASALPGFGRASYREISLYSPNRSPCRIDLSDNTNMWGVPPAARRVIEEASGSLITRYPPAYADALKRQLAGYLEVDPSWIVTGCGSDDVLDSAIRAFAEPGQSIAFPDPSFGMIPIFARMNGLTPTPIALTDDYDADVDAFLGSGAAIIYLCSPNNPTGTALSRQTIEQIVAGARGVVILDEAYAEFADRNCLGLLSRPGRLIITRTMSKAFGLAGLRVGYAAARPELAQEIEKSRGPYKVNALAELAALSALTEDRQWVRERISDAKEMRERLKSELEKRSLTPLPSQANFVFVRVERSENLAARMREAGVAVRPFTALAGFGDGIRITLGPWPMLEECLEVLDRMRRCE
jgi:histidinol-phosphate aminotransferase